MEKSDATGSATTVFALSGLYAATKEMLLDKKELSLPEQLQLAAGFWQAVSEAIPEWQMLAVGSLSPADLKRDYLCSHSVALAAIGRIGRCLLLAYPQDWSQMVQRMETLDWARTNILWRGRAVVAGKILNTRKTIVLMAGLIKSQIGLARDEEETAAELALAE